MVEGRADTVEASMLRMLKGNEFFGGLDQKLLSAMAALARRRQVRPGEIIFQKGDAGDALFAVRKGLVRILTGTSEGRRLTLNLHGPGDVFGEIALLDGRPRTADAVASEQVELLFVPRAEFQRLLHDSPETAVGVIGLLCARLRWMSERMEETNLAPLPLRLAARLLALRKDYGDEIIITQEELAQFVRSSREQVNRLLQVWRRSGVIELGRSRVRLIDPIALAHLAP